MDGDDHPAVDELRGARDAACVPVEPRPRNGRRRPRSGALSWSRASERGLKDCGGSDTFRRQQLAPTACYTRAMLSLTPAERRDLRSKAHRLRPVVSVGQHGLTAGVLHEIDVNLLAHELIKVRVFNDDRDAREAVLSRICAELEAAPVQHIGKLLVVWRPAPPAAGEERAGPRPKTKDESAKRKRQPRSQERRRRAPPHDASMAPVAAAKSTPQTRRPREPRARTPARPPSGHRMRSRPPATGGRRRRRTP